MPKNKTKKSKKMTKSKKTKPMDVQPDKNPSTRLMDMMIGWAEFVGRTGKYPDALVAEDELQGLYQASGQLAYDHSGQADETERVREFVETRVLPVLFRSR